MERGERQKIIEKERGREKERTTFNLVTHRPNNTEPPSARKAAKIRVSSANRYLFWPLIVGLYDTANILAQPNYLKEKDEI